MDASRDRVDRYGYTRLAVATVRAQAQEIEALERRIAMIEAQLAARPIAKSRRERLEVGVKPKYPCAASATDGQPRPSVGRDVLISSVGCRLPRRDGAYMRRRRGSGQKEGRGGPRAISRRRTPCVAGR